MTIGTILLIGIALALVAGLSFYIGFKHNNRTFKIVGIVTTLMALYLIVSTVWGIVFFDN